MFVTPIWFVFRMCGSNTLLRKAAICLLVTLLLAKITQDLAAFILVAVNSGSRTTSYSLQSPKMLFSMIFVLGPDCVQKM